MSGIFKYFSKEINAHTRPFGAYRRAGGGGVEGMGTGVGVRSRKGTSISR